MRIREKLPELLLEAASVVFAVLLALTAENWREHRENQRRGERAMASIHAELEANRNELASARVQHLKSLNALRAGIGAGAGDTMRTLDFTFDYALLPSAAWNAAQYSGAAQFIDYAWLIEAAQVYETQSLYLTNQTRIIDELATGMATIAGTQSRSAFNELAARLEILTRLEEGLLKAYSEVAVSGATGT